METRSLRNTLLIIACTLLCLTARQAGCETRMSVQVKTGPVRSTPTFLGAMIAQLKYADQVTVLDQKPPWMRIQHGAISGWMHASALTRKQIVLKSGAEQVGTYATTDEVALAGKGFNESVEKNFRKQHPRLSFNWVDRMEAIRISENRIKRFLKEGDLDIEGGAR